MVNLIVIVTNSARRADVIAKALIDRFNHNFYVEANGSITWRVMLENLGGFEYRSSLFAKMQNYAEGYHDAIKAHSTSL